MLDRMEKARSAAIAHKPEPWALCPHCGAWQSLSICPLGLCFLCACPLYVEPIETEKGKSWPHLSEKSAAGMSKRRWPN